MSSTKRARWDVILCDLMMSDVSGIALHAWLVECYPALAGRLVFMTGGVFTPQAAQYLSRHPIVVVEKPFEVTTLLSVVRDRVAAAREPER